MSRYHVAVKLYRKVFSSFGAVVLAYVVVIAAGSALWIWLQPDEGRPGIIGNVAIAATGLIILWYTWETRRLRLESHDQVAVSRQQAEIARQTFEAALVQARAAEDQAAVTRRLFESSQRPYLFVELQVGWATFGPAPAWGMNFRVLNYGPIPGVFLDWHVRIYETGAAAPGAERQPQASDAGICIFPNRHEDLLFSSDTPGYQGHQDLRVEFHVRYRGRTDSEYETRLTCTGRQDRWGVASTIAT